MFCEVSKFLYKHFSIIKQNNILRKISRKIDVKMDKKYISQKKDLKIIVKILPNPHAKTFGRIQNKETIIARKNLLFLFILYKNELIL